MALYEYRCEECHIRFEQLSSPSDPTPGSCPKCGSAHLKKLISRFAVGGQGDLRESTVHGCHGCHVSLPGEKSAHADRDHGEGHSHHE